MTDDSDVLIKFCEEQWAQARQSENQRATISNLIITIASALTGFIVQKGLILDSLPLAILLIILGIYGTLTSAKYYERFRFHLSREYLWRKRIDELHPEAKLLSLMKEADDWHRKKWKMLDKLRLRYLWLFLHSSVALGGIILSVIIIVRNT